MPSRRDPNSRPSARRRRVPVQPAPAPLQAPAAPQAGSGGAGELDPSGPWKLEPVPDHPGAVAVLRASESQENGDTPEAVFLDAQNGAAFAALLALLEREPLSSLCSVLAGARPPARFVRPEPLPDPLPGAPAGGGQGPQPFAWMRDSPRTRAALQLLELLVRSPQALTGILTASDAALDQVSRKLAARKPN